MSQIQKILKSVLGGIYKIELTPVIESVHQFVVIDSVIFDVHELDFAFSIEVGAERAKLNMKKTPEGTFEYELSLEMPGDNVFYAKQFNELLGKKLICKVTDNNRQTRVYGDYNNPVKLELASDTGKNVGDSNVYSVTISVEMEQQAPYFINNAEIPDYIFLSEKYIAYNGQTEFILPANAKGVNMAWINSTYTTEYNYNEELSKVTFNNPLNAGDEIIFDFITIDIGSSDNVYYELGEEQFFASENQTEYSLSENPKGVAIVMIDHVRVKYFTYNSVENKITFDYPLYEGNQVNIIYLKKIHQ